MVKLITYFYEGDLNKMDKSPTPNDECEGVLNVSMDVLRPTFRFRVNEPITFNYAYVPDLGRYYFVERVKQDGNICSVDLRVDVLNTYKEQIRQLTINLSESENGNKFLSTRNTPHITKPTLHRIEFPNDLLSEEGTMVMITIKGTE